MGMSAIAARVYVFVPRDASGVPTSSPTLGPCVLQVLQMRQAKRRAEVLPQIHPVLFRNGHKHVDDCWVKLTPRTTLNLFAGMRHRQGSAVGTVADHGIERIRNCKNARTERNLFVLQSPGVTGAVKKL